MRRIVLAASLALLLALAAGVVVPATGQAQAATPVLTVSPSTVPAGSTAMLSGTGYSPNNYVFVYWQRPDGTTNGVYGFVDTTGAFSLSLGFAPQHGSGTEFISAYDYGTGHWAPFVSVTVTNGTPPATFALTASPNPVTQASSATISGAGFSPSNYVYVQYQRPDRSTGYTFVYTDGTGAFSVVLGFPASHGCGPEMVQAYDYGRAIWSAPYTITVTC